MQLRFACLCPFIERSTAEHAVVIRGCEHTYTLLNMVACASHVKGTEFMHISTKTTQVTAQQMVRGKQVVSAVGRTHT